MNTQQIIFGLSNYITNSAKLFLVKFMIRTNVSLILTGIFTSWSWFYSNALSNSEKDLSNLFIKIIIYFSSLKIQQQKQ